MTVSIHVDTTFENRQQAARIAWFMAVQGNSEIEAHFNVNDAIALVDVAARETCFRVFNGGPSMERERLQDTYIKTSDPNGIFACDNFIIPNSVTSINVDGYPLYSDPMPSLEHLYMGWGITDVACHFVDGGNKSAAIIYLADGVGTPIASKSFSFKACRYFEFDNLPEYLKRQFIITLRDMIQDKWKGMQNGNAG